MPAAYVFRLTIVSLTAIGVSRAAPASAQDASAWQKEAHAAARLLAGAVVTMPGGSFVHAGIDIRLDPGWDTYWRYPGDSGVPPTFDFAGSQNLKSAQVEFPAPERISDGAGGNSVGYRGAVVLPLHVVPKDAARPVSLHLKLNYAVCGSICVPAQANFDLTLTGKGREEATLEKAEQRVPERITAAARSGEGLAVLSAHREPGAPHERVSVAVAAPAGAPVDLFAEGPTPDWALPLPTPTDPAPGPIRHFIFDLDGLPPGAQTKGATLTFTVVSGDHAIEVPYHLD